MAKNKHLSYNDIPDFKTDWMRDETNENKPFAGQSVQKFIKQELQASYGYSRTASGYMQFFRSPEDADLYDQGDTSRLISQTSLQGTNVEFRFVNQQAGNIYINGSEPYMLPVTVRSVDINTDGTETPHDANISLAIQVNLNNGTTTTDLGTFPANEEFLVNITPYVADGATFVLVASDDDGYRRTSSRYAVIRANLSVRTQNDTWWADAFRLGDSAWNVPLVLDVNVQAELVATIRKDNVNYVTKTVPSSQFSSNYQLVIDHPMAYGGEEGVYELHLELRATDETMASLPSVVIDTNIFCVAQDSTALLLLVNNVTDEIQNYVNNRVFNYAAFVGAGNHTVTFTTAENGTPVVAPQTVVAQTGNVGTYYVNIEMERIDDADFELQVGARFDDAGVLSFMQTIRATNKMGYAATAGASLLLKMAGRSNSESGRETMTDALSGNVITPVWQNMTWSSADGYLTRVVSDSQGQPVELAFLRLLAGQSMELPISPFKMSAAQGRTLEIMFQPRNIMNYDTPVVQCFDGSGEEFSGLKVMPSRVTLFANSARNESTQSKNFDPEEVIHLTIVVNPAYGEAGTAFPACFIYMNGVKQRVFAYNRDMNVASMLRFGSPDATIDIYAIRTYNTALTTDEVETNAVNWRISLADKEAFKARNNIKENGKVDFNKVRSLCNVFVIKSNDGQGRIPAYGMGKKDTIPSTVRFYWRDHPEWDSVIQDNVQGQGTSSQEYLRWNFKGSQSKAWALDGEHTPIKKWCAKKNVASSMHSHKMGGCEEFDYLARATGAVEQDAPRQAIWQHPFVGFSEDAQGRLSFIGLYTVGPDKGDKDTFGFGDDSIALEGSDNDRLSSNFRVPWNDSTVSVDADGEKYTVCGETAWEDAMKHPDLVTLRWKPAYNLVYETSQLIKPWKGAVVDGTTYPATLQGLTDYAGAVHDIDTSTEEGRQAYQDAIMNEYWISDSYALYRYDQPSGQYVPSFTDHAVNLAADLCDKGYVVGQEQQGGQVVDVLLTTALLQDAADDDERNTLFKQARLSKFKQEVGRYFDIVNAFFHLAWVEFKAATDNLAKNTYPYLRHCSDPNDRIRWRQDDVDTVGPIENQGKDKKPYCVELEDNYADYGMSELWVWNGRYSQFWFTLKAAFIDEYDEWVRTVFFQALHYGSSTNVLQRVMDFFQHFEFDRAQEYFGAALYNADSVWTYEQAYLYTGEYAHKGISLEQALGDHYSAEKYWIRMRAIYMMSKYKADLFAAGQTLDCFATRVGAGVNTYNITPAIYMYPVVQNGEQAIQGPRFWPGNPELHEWAAGPITTAGDQTFRINGMSYIRSVGDLFRNTLKESVSVAGQMLSTLNLGSHTAQPQEIVSTVTAVAIDNATSLRTLDMAQLSSLAGSVNLSSCANIRQVYAEGTALASIVMADGGPLDTLILGDYITTLSLTGKQMLTALSIGSTSRLTNVEMRNCNAYVTGCIMDILADVPVAQLQSVKLGFGTVASPTVLSDDDIDTLLAIGASDIETRQFSGYVTNESGSITGAAYVALEAMNITYVGYVVPDVSISSRDVDIRDGAAVLEAGGNADFDAVVVPPSLGTPRFHLYSGGALVPEDAQGISRVGDTIEFDCATGLLTTLAHDTTVVVTVSAYAGDVESIPVSVSVQRMVPIGGFSFQGPSSFVSTGDNSILLVPDNADYTVPPVSIQTELLCDGEAVPADQFLRVVVDSVPEMRLRASVLNIPYASRSYLLNVIVTDAKGNVYSNSIDLSVQSIPVQSFSLSGRSIVTTEGVYDYLVSNILPANYNRGIASLTASVTQPEEGSVSVAVNGTSGVVLNVESVPERAEDITITVTATLQGGGSVTAMRVVTVNDGVEGFVDLGLPSGLLWADRNIGAARPEDSGLYFQWGDTEGHAEGSGYDFSETNYRAKGLDSITGDLTLSQDAANAALGGDCRMPTVAEFRELYDNCTVKSTYIGIVEGVRFTSKKNGNSIFFPIASRYQGTSLVNAGGYYWSSGKAYTLSAWSMTIVRGTPSVGSALTSYYGCSVRAVQ